ncbi:helix-turn-helix domain-containing protein [Paenibacillus sp. SORGH_AS_0306]
MHSVTDFVRNKLCEAFQCQFSDLIEYQPDQEEAENK